MTNQNHADFRPVSHCREAFVYPCVNVSLRLRTALILAVCLLVLRITTQAV